MAYQDLREWISALDKAGELKRIKAEADPILEIAEITDRVSKWGPRGKHGPGGPALLFENVKGYPGAKVLINQFGIDTAEMGRALRNLVTNAIRHTPSNGVVTCWPRCRAGWPASASRTPAAASRPPTCRGSSTSPSEASPPAPRVLRKALASACPLPAASSRPTPARSPSATPVPLQFLIRLPLARPGAPVLSRTAPGTTPGHPTGPGRPAISAN